MPNEANARIAALEHALAFARDVIKHRESWTATCDTAIDAVLFADEIAAEQARPAADTAARRDVFARVDALAPGTGYIGPAPDCTYCAGRGICQPKGAGVPIICSCYGVHTVPHA